MLCLSLIHIWQDLQSALPARLSKDDSLLFAEHYISNWVEDVLLYEKAQSNIPDNGEIEKLVENYRKALIMHTYQCREDVSSLC